MKTQTANLTRLDIVGNGNRSSDQEVFTAILKRWRQKLGYCSILAAVPAMLFSHVERARADDAKKPGANVAGERSRTSKWVNQNGSNPALLKRQSEFRLPHLKSSFNMLAMLAGTDDCPGRTIPGGSYTAAAPFVDTGDTTGANDTVTLLLSPYYYYYNYNAHGPDHVYSFTLTARGPSPQIEISTTSSTYKPMVYVLRGGSGGACPSGTATNVTNFLAITDSRWTNNSSTATLNSSQINFLPLNVPLHLFIDSAQPDALGSGAYTIRMRDVNIASALFPNPIDSAEFFVRQHYLDFLSREPEQSGFDAWLRVLRDCAPGNNDCLHQARLATSAAFFGSPEFRLKGYFVFRLYRAAFGRLPSYDEIAADMQAVTGSSPSEVFAAKAAFARTFALRPEFAARFGSLSNAAYVAALMDGYGLSAITAPDPAQPDGEVKVTVTRDQLVNYLNGGALNHAQVLRAVADSDHVLTQEFNRAFVAMQYYGYLRRTPESTGFQSWLDYLNTHPQDFSEMIRGFVDSIEYRSRFGQP